MRSIHFTIFATGVTAGCSYLPIKHPLHCTLPDGVLHCPHAGAGHASLSSTCGESWSSHWLNSRQNFNHAKQFTISYGGKHL